jgi:hypothetical protein
MEVFAGEGKKLPWPGQYFRFVFSGDYLTYPCGETAGRGLTSRVPARRR